MSSYSYSGQSDANAGPGVMAAPAPTNSSGSIGGFPLRSNFFRSLPLAKETMEALYHQAKQNATACLSQSFNDQWRYVPPEKDGTQLRKDTSNLAESYRLVRAATVLRCQEHEVNMVICNTNTESWREFMRKCFGKHYVDTMILHSFSAPTAAAKPADNNRAHRMPSTDKGADDSEHAADHGERQTLWQLDGGADDGSGDDDDTRGHSDTQSVPSDEPEDADELLTVKWGALDTLGSGKRDLCLVDYLSTAWIPNTDNKERVHLWTFSSVEGERVGCMALKDTHGIARSTLTKLGMFWRRLSDEETEVIICGSFPSKHAVKVSATLLQCLSRLQGIVEDLRLSNQIYMHRSTWVKDHERSSCHLCMRNFYALRRKHHCRKCGEVICSDCSVVENVDLPVIGYSKLRLCKVCCLKAKSTPLKRNDRANVFDHLVRARSLSNVNAVASSPYGSRMSFVDTGSSSSSAFQSHPGNSANAKPSSHHGQQQQQLQQPQQQPVSNATAAAIAAAAAIRAEQLVESSTLSSSSFSSSTDNNFESFDGLDDLTPPSASVIHPIHSLDSITRAASASTTTSATITALDDDDDLDDFIDVRCLNRLQLEQKMLHKQQRSNSNMFDLLCELACQTLNCPIASVSVVDASGESIRSATGLDDKPELDDELTFFLDKVMGSSPTIVLDANVDKQVQSHLARGRGAPTIRFFAGCPIYSRTGKKLGYVCVADLAKRDTLGPSCAFTMERLATLAVTTMERNLAAKQQSGGGGNSDREREREPYNSSGAGNNQIGHGYAGSSSASTAKHPAAIFDRPVPQRHRNNSANVHLPQPMHARVYDLADADVPAAVGSPTLYSSSPSRHHASSGASSAPAAPPVAPMPRGYGEYSAGYYEAQERMRKLLIKSYHTQQQLASGGQMQMPPPSTSAPSPYYSSY
ncbi:hypothetical protein P43SY_011419 [Pythium insidiosum]|uniref:FYVE-type domain-containing protein n=1 Tax=Pythium insidiosum TaxID=114742 RepID=A0AAD5M244_PYTIN|nr:hypothetical protein P43SY_011419 [Pythium insidiosum]